MIRSIGSSSPDRPPADQTGEGTVQRHDHVVAYDGGLQAAVDRLCRLKRRLLIFQHRATPRNASLQFPPSDCRQQCAGSRRLPYIYIASMGRKRNGSFRLWIVKERTFGHATQGFVMAFDNGRPRLAAVFSNPIWGYGSQRRSYCRSNCLRAIGGRGHRRRPSRTRHGDSVGRGCRPRAFLDDARASPHPRVARSHRSVPSRSPKGSATERACLAGISVQLRRL